MGLAVLPLLAARWVVGARYFYVPMIGVAWLAAQVLRQAPPVVPVIVLAGLGILALVIAATIISVSFATRGAMASNRPIVEVLHFVGAGDRYIANRFMRHFLRLGVEGAMIGVGAASVLVGMAPTFWVVVVGRLLQGAAGALIVAVYMPIITTSVAREQRGRAIGFVITIMTVGAMAGAPLGGRAIPIRSSLCRLAGGICARRFAP